MAAQEVAQSVHETSKPGPMLRRVLWTENNKGEQQLTILTANGLDDAAYLTQLHEMADTFADEGACYFIGANEGPVKIGFAADVQKRLRHLQNASPLILKVLALASGGQTRERAYHYQFHSIRLHGEWFERTPELMAEIERLNELAKAA